MARLVVETDEVYTLEETANLLGIGIATVFRWIKSNKLIALKIVGRTVIPKSEIDRLKAARESQEENKLIRLERAFIPKSEIERLNRKVSEEQKTRA